MYIKRNPISKTDNTSISKTTKQNSKCRLTRMKLGFSTQDTEELVKPIYSVIQKRQIIFKAKKNKKHEFTTMGPYLRCTSITLCTNQIVYTNISIGSMDEPLLLTCLTLS